MPESIANVRAYVETWAPYNGGRSLAQHGGKHLFLRDLREVLDAAKIPAPASADTEGVRLTEDERVEVERGYRGNLVDIYAAVERILAARLRAATEGKGEA